MADYFTPYGNAMSYRQYPVRVISGQDILELVNEQQQTLIGHTLAYCNELESVANDAVSKAEGFYNRLVELGDVVPPKSQEEINIELLKTIQKLTDKIDRMEDSKHERIRLSGNDSESKPKSGPKNKGKPADGGTSDTSGE